MNFESARTQMLGQQLRAWDVLDDRVLDVVAGTPRERFVPEGYRELAFADTEIPIGHGHVMLAPKIEGRLLQALQVTSIDEALVVGTGSGYLTACLSRLAERVTSIDIHPEFVSGARDKLGALGISNVDCNALDIATVDSPGAFDAIAVTASMPTLDERLVRMLRPRGRLFVVVGRPPIMEARLITLHPGGEWTQESLFETFLVPLDNLVQTEPFVL
jgi:protein-L-isoaspartate(D-aspartate) O-methyltransferase